MSEDKGFEIQVEDISPEREASANNNPAEKGLPNLRGGGSGGPTIRGGFGPNGPLASPWATLVVLALIVFVWLASIDQNLKVGFHLDRIRDELVKNNRLVTEQNTTLAGLKSIESIYEEADRMWDLKVPDPTLAWNRPEGFESFPEPVISRINSAAPVAALVGDPVRARNTLEMQVDPPGTFRETAPRMKPASVKPQLIISERISVSFEAED